MIILRNWIAKNTEQITLALGITIFDLGLILAVLSIFLLNSLMFYVGVTLICITLLVATTIAVSEGGLLLAIAVLILFPILSIAAPIAIPIGAIIKKFRNQKPIKA